MERVVRIFDRFEDAEADDLAEWLALSGEERVEIGEAMRLTEFAEGHAPFVRQLRVRDADADEE